MKSSLAPIVSSLALSLVGLAHAQTPQAPQAPQAPAVVTSMPAPQVAVSLQFAADTEFAKVLAANLPFWKGKSTRVVVEATFGALLDSSNGKVLLSCFEKDTELKGCSLTSAPIAAGGLQTLDLATVLGWFANATEGVPTTTPISFAGNPTVTDILAKNLPGLYTLSTRVGTEYHVGALVPSAAGPILISCSIKSPFFSTFGGPIVSSKECVFDSTPFSTKDRTSIELTTVFGWFAAPPALP
jgi:hypothetical protein